MSTRHFSPARVAHATAAVVAVPARGASRPEVHYLNGTSDKAASVFAVQRGVSVHTIAADADAPGTTLVLDDVAGLDDAQQVVLQPAGGGPTAVGVIADVDAETKTVTLTGVNLAMPKGSALYRMQAYTTLPCGAATKEYEGKGGTPILIGREGMPMTVALDGTAACAVNLVTGAYAD